MGLWGLADFLTGRGFECKIIHTGVEEEFYGNFDISRYLGDDLLAVGFSLHWFPMAAESVDLAEQVKKINPDLFVVMGGFTSSFFCKDLLKLYPAIDGIVRGDGEKPMLSLLKTLKAKETSLEMVPNLVWRNDGEVVSNPFTYVATSNDLKDVSLGNYRTYLNNYAFARDSVSFAKKSTLVADYQTDFPLSPMFYLLTGKGCPVDCTMCGGGQKAQYILNRREACLYLDDEIIVRTIREAKDHGYQSVYVCFDPTPEDPHYYYWLKRLRDEKLDVNLCFGFWALPTEEAVDQIKLTSKNVLVDLSPETINENSRRRNKGFHYTNKDFHACLDMLWEKSVYTHVYFSYFLPFQTEQELADTRQAYWEINSQYPHFIEATILKISTDPCSPLYRNPEEYGVRLTVSGLKEHIELCRTNPKSNILVHEIKTVTPDAQTIIERKFTFDTTLKRLFRYNSKFLVRAFPSVEDFIRFLDGFYHANNLLDPSSTPRGFETHIDIMNALKEHTQQFITENNGLKPYLADLVEFTRALIIARDGDKGDGVIPVSLTDKEVLERIPKMPDSTVVLDLKFNLFEANQSLRTEKKFPQINESETLLMISGGGGSPVIEQINDSMLELCKACRGNGSRTTKQIVKSIAEYYSSDQQEQEAIQDDLVATVRLLNQQQRLSLA